MATRVQIQVRGLVQGVGFRPFVFSLAGRFALRGRVFNNGDGVLIDVEGDCRAIERFIAEVCRSLESNGFDVFTHRRTPANDGGVSLGQAAVANARLVAGRS
jgi:hydrogenase maturation factor HypF (carbamoyltransferase family)